MEQTQFVLTTNEQIENTINKVLKIQLDELKKNFQPKEPSEFLTRNEVAKLFKIDLSTVHNWSKNGKLIPYGIGGRVYFKLNEVEKSMIRLEK